MKTKYFLLIGFISFQLTVFSQSAQQLRIDSLRKALPALNDTARVDCLNELATLHWSLPLPLVGRKDSLYHYALLANQQAVKIGYEYGNAMSLIWLAEYEIFGTKNMTTADDYINQSIRIGEKIKDHSVLGRAYLMRSELGGKNRDSMNSIDCLRKSRDHFIKAGDKEGELEVTTWLCQSNLNEGKYEEGFDFCDRCIQLIRLIKPQSNWHHELVQWSFLDMAELYEAAGDYPTAMEYIQQSDEYARVNGLHWYMDLSKSGLFYRMGQYDSAMLYWQKWKKGYNSYAEGHQAVGNNILAQIYFSAQQYDKAVKILESSIASFRKRKRSPPLSNTLMIMAKIYIQKESWNTAFKYANEGFMLAKKENIRPSVVEGHELLSRIYHAQGKNEQAYDHLRQYTTLKDSVLNRQFLWRLNTYKKTADDEKKKASIELLNKDNDIKDQQLKQENLLKKFLIAGLITLMLVSFFIWRALRLKQKNAKLQQGRFESELTVHKLESEKKHAVLRQQATELEMQALRAQMSPHFIFNCLSSINRFILKHESEAASDYLTRFSRLIRMVLSNSKKSLIPLEDELEMIGLYVEMEKLRFKDSFDFNISFTSEIDPSAIFIPPLLLQPFAENAIWHGLMNKEGHGQLDIAFTSDKNMLTCTITDNGVGRKQADALKSKKDVKGKSMGLQITANRLAKLNLESNHDTSFTMEDLYDPSGEAAGTKVVLKIRMAYALQELLTDQHNFAYNTAT